MAGGETPLWKSASSMTWTISRTGLSGATLRFSPARWLSGSATAEESRGRRLLHFYLDCSMPAESLKYFPADRLDKLIEWYGTALLFFLLAAVVLLGTGRI